MPDVATTYRVRVQGLWHTSHSFTGNDGALGVLKVSRNAKGLIAQGRYAPAGKGEVLILRRDPGLLRSQFSLWTEGREWLGSSLRPHIFKREIAIHTGSRPMRIVPRTGFGLGWVLVAPRTGEMARIVPSIMGRGAVLEVQRRLEFELLVFVYFVASQLHWESFWPGPELRDPEEVGTASTPAGA